MSDDPIRFPEGPSDEDIAERLKRVRAELDAMELPELPEERIPQVPPGPAAPDVDDRLREMDEKVRRVKGRWEAAQRQEAKQNESSAQSSKGLGLGLSIAYTIIGLPLVGYGVGVLISNFTGDLHWKGNGGFVGSVLGVVGAILMLNRHQKDSE